jgi:hypothetical protein
MEAVSSTRTLQTTGTVSHIGSITARIDFGILDLRKLVAYCDGPTSKVIGFKSTINHFWSYTRDFRSITANQEERYKGKKE